MREDPNEMRHFIRAALLVKIKLKHFQGLKSILIFVHNSEEF